MRQSRLSWLQQSVLLIGPPLVLLFLAKQTTKAEEFSGMLPNEVSSKEMKTNFKILLTKLKIRNVPLVKRRNEEILSGLYKEKRELEGDIEEIEKNIALAQIANGGTSKASGSESLGLQSVHAKISQLGKFKNKELEYKRARLAKINASIAETRSIIKHPENYILVPKNYGDDPEGQRKKEREILIKDRENMLFRYKITSGAVEPPLWLIDEW